MEVVVDHVLDDVIEWSAPVPTAGVPGCWQPFPQLPHLASLPDDGRSGLWVDGELVAVRWDFVGTRRTATAHDCEPLVTFEQAWPSGNSRFIYARRPWTEPTCADPWRDWRLPWDLSMDVVLEEAHRVCDGQRRASPDCVAAVGLLEEVRVQCRRIGFPRGCGG